MSSAVGRASSRACNNPVVATGLNKPVQRTVQPPAATTRGDSNERMRVVSRNARPTTGTSSFNAADYDRPAVARKAAVGDGLRAEVDSDEMLDIPAFLRRQAD